MSQDCWHWQRLLSRWLGPGGQIGARPRSLHEEKDLNSFTESKHLRSNSNAGSDHLAPSWEDGWWMQSWTCRKVTLGARLRGGDGLHFKGAKQNAKVSQGKCGSRGEKEERQACHGKMRLRIMSEKILKEPWPYIDPKLLKCGTSYALRVSGL